MTRRLRLTIVLLVVSAAALVGLRVVPHRALSVYAPTSTAVYSAEGRLMRLTLASDEQYRLWTPLPEMPPQLVDALLLHEDQYYAWHPGVNPVALSRATVNALSGRGHAGASTITMQLARRLYHLQTRSVVGKFKQIAASLWLSARYSKRDILEAHLNLLPYGGNVQGIGAASLIYFDKHPVQLTLAESCALVVIPQSPKSRTPRGIEPESLRSARLRLLDRWSHDHVIDAGSLRMARAPLNFGDPAALPFIAPHLTDMLLAGRRNQTSIQSTTSMPLQRLLERTVSRYVAANRSRGILNASAMLVDLRNLEVKAVVGSARYSDAAIAGQVNGTLAKRSPGSTLKPFIYALAMDQGLIHPRTMLKDAPVAFGPYSPENFDGTFVGPIAAQDALIGSRNIPAVALAAKLSQPSFYQFLKSTGVSRMAGERHYGLALALGGGEVTMEELATLYAALGEGGTLRGLRYTRDSPAGPAIPILSPEASFMVLDILSHNPRPGELEEGSSTGRAVAWKTGTSWGFRDAWSAGIVGSYVLVVWVGNFDGSGNPSFVGLKAAAPLFFTLADAIDSTAPSPPAPGFTIPMNVRRVEVCAASGDLPNADCPQRVPTWYVPGRSPIRVSSIHRRVRIDTRTGRQACPDTPEGFSHDEIFEYWPSDISALYAKAGMPRRPPPADSDCASTPAMATAKPSITSPMSGATYEIHARQMGTEPLTLVANADGAVQTLYWFVDSGFIGTSTPSSLLSWAPAHAGAFNISVVDDRGVSDSRPLLVGLIP
jgi:penicillin-binding protein 1C